MMPGLKAERLANKQIHFVASEHWVFWTTRLLGNGVSGALMSEQEMCLCMEVNLDGKSQVMLKLQSRQIYYTSFKCSLSI